MQPPSDLSEGWYWCRWHEGPPTVERVYRSDVLGAWMMGRNAGTSDHRLDVALSWAAAMESVAPPSWERGE